jgi:hypothetical protein
VRFGVAWLARRRFFDEPCRAFDLADLVVGAADQERVVRVLVWSFRNAADDLSGFLDVPLAEEGVELQEQRVDDFFVGLGEIERLIAHVDGLVEFAHRVDVHLGCIEHRLEVRLVERDRLAVVLDGLARFALERGDVAEQVVRLGRLRVDLERPPGRRFRPPRVAALDEVPSTVEVGRELVHGD